MNNKFYYAIITWITGAVLFSGTLFSQEKDAQVIATNQQSVGTSLEIYFQKGVKHYYPLMAVWVEDMDGNYIHPLYVARSMAKGIFGHVRYEEGTWHAGKKLIPSALPYWSHKRNAPGSDSLYIPTPENPLPDAYTGATPTGDFILETLVADSVGDHFRVLFEINQSWDWNEYWYNNKYPNNKEYLKSAQPALVYEATIDLTDTNSEYTLKPIGHSHPYGATGKLFSDLSTLTTALDIAKSIQVKIK